VICSGEPRNSVKCHAEFTAYFRRNCGPFDIIFQTGPHNRMHYFILLVSSMMSDAVWCQCMIVWLIDCRMDLVLFIWRQRKVTLTSLMSYWVVELTSTPLLTWGVVLWSLILCLSVLSPESVDNQNINDFIKDTCFYYQFIVIFVVGILLQLNCFDDNFTLSFFIIFIFISLSAVVMLFIFYHS